jgi:hypothetical protein
MEDEKYKPPWDVEIGRSWLKTSLGKKLLIHYFKEEARHSGT